MKRLTFALVCLAVALLTVVPAPNDLLWKVGVVATEWGYLVAGVALCTLVPGWRTTAAGRAAGLIGIAAAILALTPLARAIPVSRALPGQMQAAFGAAPPANPCGGPLRASPLSAAGLVLGGVAETVHSERKVYVERDRRSMTLDLRRPPGRLGCQAMVPIVVVVHGGSWQDGDSGEFASLNDYLAERGYLVAAINYRLAPEWRFPAAREDVMAAVAYLKRNGSDLGGDGSRIVLLGRSAGGQLALSAAYTSRDGAIRGVVAFYAPSDLQWAYENPRNPAVIDSRGTLQAYLGGSPDVVPAAYQAASPAIMAGRFSPPTLLIHGVRDDVVSVVNSERLDRRLQEAGVPHLLIRFPWATHACDYNFGGPCGQISAYAVERFVATVVQRP